MKKYMKNLLIFATICFLIGIVGRASSVGSSDWNFVFENMIWFPIEVVITILVLDKIIDERDANRDRLRFEKMTRRANPILIRSLKRNLTAMIVDNSVYDSNRDDKKIFNSIRQNPSEYLTKEFFNKQRVFHIIDKGDQIYNWIGISHYYCKQAYDELQKYEERYIVMMDDEVLDIVINLQNTLYGVGALNYAPSAMWLSKNNFVMDEGSIHSIVELFELTAKLQNIFEKIQKLS